jgi:outer membrane protein TolC
MVLGAPLYAQEKTQSDSILRLSLKEAQAYSILNNRSILNANIDVENAKKKIWETTAVGLPQVSAKGSFSYTPELSKIIESFSSYGSSMGGGAATINMNDMKWSLTGDITVSQLIFSGSYIVGLQSAKVYKSLADLNRVKSEQDVIESIGNTYFMVLIARENAMILDSTYKNIELTLYQMTKMNTQGFVEETDVDQLNITLANIKSSLDFIKRQSDLSEKMLKLQLGIDFDQKIALTDSLNTLLHEQTFVQLILADFVLDNNVNYQMLETQVKASELLLKLQKSECLPNLAAFYQYEKNFNDKAFSFTAPHTIGASLSIPIFASGSRWAKIKQAQNDLKKAEYNRDQMSDGLKLQYYQAKATLINARDKYDADKQNLQLAEKIYKRSLIKYQNGVISSLDLTQAQTQFLTSQSTYYQSIQSLISEKNKLEKMLTKF